MHCLCGVMPSRMGPPGSDTPHPTPSLIAGQPLARVPGVLRTRQVRWLPRCPARWRRVARLMIMKVMLRKETRVLSSPARHPQPPPQEQSPGFRAPRVSRHPRLIPISEQKRHGNLPDKHSATRALMLRSPSKLFFQTLCQQNKCLCHWRSGVCVRANSQEHRDKISWPACSPGRFQEHCWHGGRRGSPQGAHPTDAEPRACPEAGPHLVPVGLSRVPVDARLGFIYKVAEGIHLQGAIQTCAGPHGERD